MDRTTEQQLARYRRLRAVLKDLHSNLVEQLPKHALESGGKALGIYKRGVLVFGSEDETSVLMDYCIYDYRWDGHNVIERYVKVNPHEAGSDKRVLLDAMLQARYSLLVIDEVVRGVGAQTHDLFRGGSDFIIDIALGNTAEKGLVLASRIISPDDGKFSMTTGAGLPADSSILARIKNEIPQRFGRTIDDVARASREKPAEFSAAIIRMFLEEDASSSVKYADVAPETTTRAGPRVGRNELCPCGSGKKYKKCCGKAAED